MSWQMIDEVVLFHGSLEEIKVPTDDRTTSLSTDFGDGFYLTSIQRQAEEWAVKKYKKLRFPNKYARPTVNIYLLDKEKVLGDKGFKPKYFSQINDEWLDFIISNRNDEEHLYDYVEGPMSEDRVYNFVKDLLEGKITRQKFWELAASKYPTHQIMIRNDATQCLSFIKSYEVAYV